MLTSFSECKRRYCLLGLASISDKTKGRYSCRFPQLRWPRAYEAADFTSSDGELNEATTASFSCGMLLRSLKDFMFVSISDEQVQLKMFSVCGHPPSNNRIF